MPGMAPISLQQFINPTTGSPYSGARAAFYEASTQNPIAVYQDYGLGTAHPNPVIADAYGRFPPIFIDEAVGFYRLRITTSGGVVLPLGESGSFDIPVLPVIGPVDSGGGGSEVPVDPNSVMLTGDAFWTPRSGTRAGFVRMNGRTIGSASSGATERANADAEDLYTFAWTNFSDTICAVTGGRGANAAADWAANKPIATIDMRNKGAFGLDDMGNTAAGGFSGITFAKGGATTGGSSGGAARKTLATSEIPSHSHGVTDAGHIHNGLRNNGVATNARQPSDYVVSGTGGAIRFGAGANEVSTVSATTGITIDNAGGGQAFDKMSPFVLGTWLWRL